MKKKYNERQSSVPLLSEMYVNQVWVHVHVCVHVLILFTGTLDDCLKTNEMKSLHCMVTLLPELFADELTGVCNVSDVRRSPIQTINSRPCLVTSAVEREARQHFNCTEGKFGPALQNKVNMLKLRKI